MRIGYFADGPWGRRALKRIEEAPELEVAFVVLRHDAPDSELKSRAGRLGVPTFAPEDINASAILEELAGYEPDLNVSMSYDQILRSEAIEMAPEGFINCHAGALPFYRGRNVLNWALINGEERFGVTVHDVEQGIDTGDILVRRLGPIAPDDDYGSLLDRAADLCADVLLEALEDIRNGTASRTPQEEIHPVGFYSSRRREGDEWIDWTWPTARIHNLIRALAPPGPGARTLLDGDSVVLLGAERIPQAPAYIDRPGTVVGRGEGGVVVKTGDTTLRVTTIADWAGGEPNHSRTPRLRVGTTFGMNLQHEVQRLSGRIDRLERRLEALEE